MNITFSLHRLQSLDTQRLKAIKRLAEIEQILLADETVKSALLERNASAKTYEEYQNAVKDLQNQVSEKKLKFELTQAKLFGGKIRSPKELQDLQAESESLKRTISKLEDDQLAEMLKSETAQTEFSQADQYYQKVLDQKASENSLLLGEKKKLEAELPKIDAQREGLRAPLPSDILELYDSLLKSRGGLAVTLVEDESCEACGYQVSPGDRQAAKSPTKILRCKNCGRILIMS